MIENFAFTNRKTFIQIEIPCQIILRLWLQNFEIRNVFLAVFGWLSNQFLREGWPQAKIQIFLESTFFKKILQEIFPVSFFYFHEVGVRFLPIF